MDWKIFVRRREHEDYSKVVNLPDIEAAEEFIDRKMDEYDDVVVGSCTGWTV